MAQANGLNIWVTNTGITYDWQGQDAQNKPTRDPISVEFEGATGQGRPVGLNKQPGLNNYYKGKAQAQKVRSFARATIQDLYKGIDLVTYFDEQEKRPRYDLIVHPGADPSQIRMRFTGAKDLKVDKEGSLSYQTSYGKVEEQRQMAYQTSDVGPDFHFFPKQVLNQDKTVSFDVAGYQKDRTLVIDPLIWSTYLGGTSATNILNPLQVDPSGNVYVTGTTNSVDFPTRNAEQQLNAGFDAYVAKFDNAGNCIFSTFYGGSHSESESSGTFDLDGRSYLVGNTSSNDLRVTDLSTIGPFSSSAFIAAFDTSGALFYASFISDLSDRTGNFPIGVAVAPDSSVDVFTQGFSSSGVSLNTYHYDVDTAVQLNATRFTQFGSAIWSSFALSSGGEAYLVGRSTPLDEPLNGYQPSNANSGTDNPQNENGLLLRFNRNLDTILGGTFIGGIGDVEAYSVAVNPVGEPIVTGTVVDNGNTFQGVNLHQAFVTTPGALALVTPASEASIFVSHFAQDLSSLIQASLIMRTDASEAPRIVIDSGNRPVILGHLGSIAPPITWDYFSGHYAGSYMARLSDDLSSIQYATYVGSTNLRVSGLAVDAFQNLYVSGAAFANELPVTSTSFDPVFSRPGLGFIEAINPVVTPGLQRITSDRGAAPSLSGGSGRTVNVTVYFAEPDGTAITLSSPNPSVHIDGGSSSTFTASGSIHAATFSVRANDVATPTPVLLTASDGTNTLPITLTIQPFLRLLVMRPVSASAGATITALVYPYEVPLDDRQVSFQANPSFALAGTPTVTINGLNGGHSISGPTTATMRLSAQAPTEPGTISAHTVGGASTASSAFNFHSITVQSAVLSPSSVTSGGTASATLTLAAPSFGSNTIVLTNNVNLDVLNVSFPDGATTASQTFVMSDLFSAASSVSVNYVASSDGSFKTVGHQTLLPNRITALDLPATVVEGDSFLMDAELLYPAQNSTFLFGSSNQTSITSMQVHDTGNDIVFSPVATTSVGLTAPRTMQMTLQWMNHGTPSGPIATASIQVIPLLASISLTNATVKGGTAITGNIQLAEIYKGSQTITVNSNSPLAYFTTPGTLSTTLSTHGKSAIPFTLQTSTVTKPTTITITLPTPLGYKTKTFNVTLTP